MCMFVSLTPVSLLAQRSSQLNSGLFAILMLASCLWNLRQSLDVLFQVKRILLVYMGLRQLCEYEVFLFSGSFRSQVVCLQTGRNYQAALFELTRANPILWQTVHMDCKLQQCCDDLNLKNRQDTGGRHVARESCSRSLVKSRVFDNNNAASLSD